ncbi:hypothetical protein GCM10009601_14380 [Streptomyces thermospinosisporus]|uniref:Uncharacterized protein n=1 Tax=Streptomyces thermospinosisporus TaxID=161482 RepID=A0ABN1YNB3_9ACTN
MLPSTTVLERSRLGVSAMFFTPPCTAGGGRLSVRRLAPDSLEMGPTGWREAPSPAPRSTVHM